MKQLSRISVVTLAVVLATFTLTAQDKMDAMGKKSMAMAQMWKGYLVDKMCATGYVKDGDVAKANTKGAKHTKSCALEENCMESGYGLIIDGKYVKFDQGGDKMAADFLNKSKKKDNFLVEVSGTKDGDLVKVKSIAEAKTEMMGKKGSMK